MAEAVSSDRSEIESDAVRRVRVIEPEPEPEPPTVVWRTIRFIELFFAVSCMSSLMALYVMNPIHDDYTQLCEDIVGSVWSPKTNQSYRSSTEALQFQYDDRENELLWVPVIERKADEPRGQLTTNSHFPGFEKFLFRLSYAIILFTLVTTVLVVLFLDLVSRLLGEPINKLPMIFMLILSELLCLIIMVLGMDMFLGAINSMILAVCALAFGLSICFATDLVYTSVRGNG